MFKNSPTNIHNLEKNGFRLSSRKYSFTVVRECIHPTFIYLMNACEVYGTSQVVQWVKNLPALQEMHV